MSWLTPLSTGPEDWRKWRMRIAVRSLLEAFPDGPPMDLTFKRTVDAAKGVCSERGWPAPGDRTYQRAINGT